MANEWKMGMIASLKDEKVIITNIGPEFVRFRNVQTNRVDFLSKKEFDKVATYPE